MLMLMGSVGRKGRNLRADVLLVQRLLNQTLNVSCVPLRLDGLVGSKTIFAIEYFQRNIAHFHKPDGLIEPGGKSWSVLSRSRTQQAVSGTSSLLGDTVKVGADGKIAWGAKVSAAFKEKVVEISLFLEVSPDYLMACMAFETGEKFEASIKNAVGSGAVGLIQFMPSTAKGIGTSTDALSKMSAVTQLDYVKRYFAHFKGKLKTLEDVYMAILYPAAVGKSSGHVLFQEGRKTYQQNKGFDANSDGKITLAEISQKVKEKYEKGLLPGYLG